ncbi:MAG: hypothetical protein K940chlam9_02091 [Chlamydiae bacterium]|nr:hypothetical protein [Chlamydiota bacterium]
MQAGRVGVDLELYSTFHSAASIPLSVYAIGISILAGAVPSDDKATIIEGCHAWAALIACPSDDKVPIIEGRYAWT